MHSNEELIAALKKGREIRPIHWTGTLFHGDDAACALGAIAVGLGYQPDEEASWGVNDTPGYVFLTPRVGEHIGKIWRQNDACWLGRKEIVDSDEEIIRYLTDGKLVYHNSSDKVV